jgi:ribosome-associated protein
MDSKKLALLCQELAENKKAESTVVPDMKTVSSITDYFILTSGTSAPHLRAIAEEIKSTLNKKHKLQPQAVDGETEAAWIVLDYFDVIIHIMLTDLRDRYDLEGLWSDAPRVKPPRKPAARKTLA